MELITYVSSQMVFIFAYIFVGLTYHVKNRKVVLRFNLLAQIAFIITYILLKAWSGVAVSVIALIRNIILIFNENKNNKTKNDDIITLIIIYVISIILAIITYEGLYSLLPVLATMIYTYAVYQKNVKTYKVLGIPIQVLWIIYAISLMSIVSIFVETAMLINCFVGLIRENKTNSSDNKE